MAMRIPRGFERNVPPYREISEGVRPHIRDLALKAYSGLAYVRMDEYHHDPIVLDAGTLVGLPTGGAPAAEGFLVPCTFVTGSGSAASGLKTAGDAASASTFGLPGASQVTISCGIVKPLGVVYQPVYSSILETAFTNYKRTDNVGVVTDYVISVPAINSEEVLIEPGDVVMVGNGHFHGAGITSTHTTNLLAGRYAKYNSSAYLANERIVGRCLYKQLLGTASGASAGDTLSTHISAGTFTISTAAEAEFASLAMVQTVPGLGNSGSGTAGIPSYLLSAQCNAAGAFYALTLLIRL